MHAPGPAVARKGSIVLRLPLPGQALRAMGTCIALLLALHLAIQKIPSDTFHHMFDLNDEANIPAWYASLQLVLLSALLAVAAVVRNLESGKPHGRTLGILSFLFAFFSMDEVAMVHEHTTMVVNKALNLSGMTYIRGAWRGIYLLIALALLGYTWTGLCSFVRDHRRQFTFFMSGCTVFILGGVGLERVGELGLFTGWAQVAVEEGLELSGVALMIAAVLDYIHLSATELELRGNVTP